MTVREPHILRPLEGQHNNPSQKRSGNRAQDHETGHAERRFFAQNDEMKFLCREGLIFLSASPIIVGQSGDVWCKVVLKG